MREAVLSGVRTQGLRAELKRGVREVDVAGLGDRVAQVGEPVRAIAFVIDDLTASNA